MSSRLFRVTKGGTYLGKTLDRGALRAKPLIFTAHSLLCQTIVVIKISNRIWFTNFPRADRAVAAAASHFQWDQCTDLNIPLARLLGGVLVHSHESGD